jgi:hypothetical protein
MAYDINYDKSARRASYLVVAIVIVVIAAIGGWFLWSKSHNSGTDIETGKYQAVFLTNGQVYFGKLRDISPDFLQLSDVYYLQTKSSSGSSSSNPQSSTTDQSNVQLIKLGDEVHGPEDQMTITKSQVLFYENIKADGQVGKLIKDMQSTNSKK